MMLALGLCCASVGILLPHHPLLLLLLTPGGRGGGSRGFDANRRGRRQSDVRALLRALLLRDDAGLPDDDDDDDRRSVDRRHPRVACVVGVNGATTTATAECPSFAASDAAPSRPRTRRRRRRRRDADDARGGGTSEQHANHRDIEEAALSSTRPPPPPPPLPWPPGDDYDWVDLIHKVETEECTFADRTYQAARSAPSTCNDVHSMAFQFGGGPADDGGGGGGGGGGGVGSTASARLGGGAGSITTRFLTHGGYRDVWALTQHLGRVAAAHGQQHDDDDDDDPYGGMAAMKTNRMDKRGWSAYVLDKHRRDALVSEKAGGPPHVPGRHVVPLFHYCAFTSVVPISTSGTLSSYVRGLTRDAKTGARLAGGGVVDPVVAYVLAMQAARGLYQAHLYRRGGATNAIADVKPAQFLLFERRRWRRTGGGRNDDRRRRERRRKEVGDEGDDDEYYEGRRAAATSRGKKTATERAVEDNADVPLLQIQDFNRGRYLGISRADGRTTCPFRICDVDEFWNFRSPEEYSGLNSFEDDACVGQDDKIDVWALGGVFYYLLSDGQMPFYYVDDFDEKMKLILGGAKSKLPDSVFPPSGEDAEIYDAEERRRISRRREERSKHPAHAALGEVMMECWEYKPEDRPSSLRVVQMLEKKWDEMNVHNISE